MTVLKAIVAFLALANIGYFLWARGVAPPAAVPEPVAAPSRLRLASESAGIDHATAASAPAAASAAADAGAAPGAAAAPALLTDVKRCISVGPFPDVAQAAHAAATLRGGGYTPRQRVAEGDVWAGVWVYLPLPAGADAVERLRAKLKSAGIDDALDMPGPNDTPVISLGLFSDPRRAQARVAQAQKYGVNPAVADRKRSGDVYWVDVDLKPTDGLLNPADLQGESGRIVRLEVKACPSGSGGAP